MAHLNHLEYLALDARTKGGLTERWDALINVYFRGDDPIGQIKEWAKTEGLHASFNYLEYSPTHCVVESVTFLPLKKAT